MTLDDRRGAPSRESEFIALMQYGHSVGKTVMRGWVAEMKIHGGRLNAGQKAAVKTILATKDRVVGVRGYAGTIKTTMLKRLRMLTVASSRRLSWSWTKARSPQASGYGATVRSSRDGSDGRWM